ncbi:MAG TPA: beta-eliminating lyase-related protein, partial [Caldilineaceae bacterium]|nr:beta-eliminating lyase-related protein [Caldilineaceae bacterium]
GALRQGGYLAAAGLYALDHNIERLAEDHANAKRFGAIATQCAGVRLDPEPETNLVFLNVAETGLTAKAIAERLEQRGINIGAMGKTRLRAVTHLDISQAQAEEAGRLFVEVVNELRET